MRCCSVCGLGLEYEIFIHTEWLICDEPSVLPKKQRARKKKAGRAILRGGK